MESNRNSASSRQEQFGNPPPNHRNEFGDTLLTQSLKANESDDFIINLMKTGCNVNISDSDGVPPLHLAMRRPSAAVAYEMLKYGVNIDDQDVAHNTALHHAVYENNAETLCMLLCCGADVTIPNGSNETPLLTSLRLGELEMATLLFDYYDESSTRKITKKVTYEYLLHSLSFGDYMVFKSAWPDVNHELLLNRSKPFLMSYLDTCEFPTSEWLECLLLMLSSPVASRLVQECVSYARLAVNTLLCTILVICSKKKLPPKDILALVYLCTSLGATTNSSNLYLVYRLYGFSKEFEALVYTGDFNRDLIIFKPVTLVPAFYIHIDRERFFEVVISAAKCNCSMTELLQALGHFWMSSAMKHELKHLVKIYYGCEVHHIAKKLKQIPKVPLLLELSRNQVRKVITNNCQVTKLYQLYDVVKKLDLPQKIENVLLFKSPIYF